ncbi:UDP-galactose/UDP-glucose transporter 3, partial [Cucurbita argyrosperma subsp. sororia]
MEAHGSGLRRVLVLAFCVAGIWSAYIYQGVLQETLSTKRFGSDGKRFEHLSFLNLAQNVVCLIWSYIMIKLWSSRSTVGAPWWTYWSAGITNTIGPAMGIEALKYISYPAQVLAKSSKMIPVMLMGTLVYGIKYTFPEYLCTFLVAGGVSTFALLKTSSKTISKLAHPNAPLGYGLCFLNLAFDGFTNATQDSISTRYPKTSAWDIMLGMNLWASRGSVGHSSVLSLWSSRPKFYLPNNKSIRFPCQYHHYHNSQVCQHRGVLYAQWKSSVIEAVGLRCNGLLGAIISNLPQVEEAAKVAEKEKDHLTRNYRSSLLFYFPLFDFPHNYTLSSTATGGHHHHHLNLTHPSPSELQFSVFFSRARELRDIWRRESKVER